MLIRKACPGQGCKRSKNNQWRVEKDESGLSEEAILCELCQLLKTPLFVVHTKNEQTCTHCSGHCFAAHCF